MPSDEIEGENEHHYAKQVWIWILMALLLLVGIVAVVALIMPFLYSPTYPNGYNIVNIATTISDGFVVPSDTISAYNRNLYIFNPPASATGNTVGATASLPLANVKQGMQLAVSNKTAYPLEVTAGNVMPASSHSISLATVNSQGQYNKCIPTSLAGSFAFFSTKTTIPPNATFFFIAPSDNNLNLVQSTPIDVTYSGTFTAPVCPSM
jgi:hypothetical protein